MERIEVFPANWQVLFGEGIHSGYTRDEELKLLANLNLASCLKG